MRVRAGALSNAAQALTAGSTALVDTKTPGRAAPLDVSRTDITKTTSTNVLKLGHPERTICVLAVVGSRGAGVHVQPHGAVEGQEGNRNHAGQRVWTGEHRVL